MRKVNEWVRLLKNIAILGGIGLVAFLIYRYFANSNNDTLIDRTPIHIESIKTIAEISTVSYKDEVVIDTVERYKEIPSITEDPFSGPTAVYNRYIKRRLTLIVKGELRYGIDITDGNFKIEQNTDTIWLNLPKAKVLDINVTPSETEIFEEIGNWPDYVTTNLESKAKVKLRKSADKLQLSIKAEENARKLFNQLIITEKKLIVNFD